MFQNKRVFLGLLVGGFALSSHAQMGLRSEDDAVTSDVPGRGSGSGSASGEMTLGDASAQGIRETLTLQLAERAEELAPVYTALLLREIRAFTFEKERQNPENVADARDNLEQAIRDANALKIVKTAGATPDASIHEFQRTLKVAEGMVRQTYFDASEEVPAEESRKVGRFAIRDIPEEVDDGMGASAYFFEEDNLGDNLKTFGPYTKFIPEGYVSAPPTTADLEIAGGVARARAVQYTKQLAEGSLSDLQLTQQIQRDVKALVDEMPVTASYRFSGFARSVILQHNVITHLLQGPTPISEETREALQRERAALRDIVTHERWPIRPCEDGDERPGCTDREEI